MVSVIIPCYNYARFLPHAIRSVLDQRINGGPAEIVVVDDGSTDETAKVAAGFGNRVCYVHQLNQGLAAARNTGMKHATYDSVLFLDSDDMIVPDSLDILWNARQSLAPRPVVLASRDIDVDVNGAVIGTPVPSTGALRWIDVRQLIIRNRFACSVLADRRALLQLDGFDPSLRACEDRDMWIRVAARHPIAYLDLPVLLRRKHGSNLSRRAAHQTDYIQKVLAKASRNSDIDLPAKDWKLAQAICWYQSALMFAESSDYRMAIWQILRSFSELPMDRAVHEGGVASFGRIRCLIGMARRALFARNPLGNQ
jgi:glycosyltransferase involved in cell wall biosynthesis